MAGAMVGVTRNIAAVTAMMMRVRAGGHRLHLRAIDEVAAEREVQHRKKPLLQHKREDGDERSRGEPEGSARHLSLPPGEAFPSPDDYGTAASTPAGLRSAAVRLAVLIRLGSIVVSFDFPSGWYFYLKYILLERALLALHEVIRCGRLSGGEGMSRLWCQDKVKRLSTGDVVRAEFREIWGKFPAPSSLKAFYKASLQKDQAALCLSGGGIRSAAFGLGVLEALARKDLLTEFHYLSTVSGGGYIGGFLARWIHEEKGDVYTVQSQLSMGVTPGRPEPSPLQWLRDYSNFLTPRTGLASLDTWTAAVLWMRNTLINWFVFLPFFVAVAALLHLYQTLLIEFPSNASAPMQIIALACIVFGTCLTSLFLPSHSTERMKRRNIFRFAAVPALAASFTLPLALSPALLSNQVIPSPWLPLGQNVFSLAGSIMSVGLVLGFLWAGTATRHLTFLHNFLVWLVGALISGSAVAVAVYLWTLFYPHWPGPKPSAEDWHVGVYAAFGPLSIVIAQLLLIIYYTAFRIIPEAPGHRLSPDLDREWLARLSALKLRFSVVVAMFCALVLIGPALLTAVLAYHDIGPLLLAAISGGSGLTAVFGGKADVTGDTTARGWQSALTLNRIVLAASFVFLALLTISISMLEVAAAGIVKTYAADAPEWLGRVKSVASTAAGPDVLGHLAVLLIAASLTLWASRKINVNRFSLNAVYRNRLCRAFLGAARWRSRPLNVDPFTDFDPADNVPMTALRYRRKVASGPRRILFPVINTALNLVGSERLAWQERKAHSFIITPLACGSDELGRPDAFGNSRGAYIAPEQYAGNEKDWRMWNTEPGITLASAMTISGAAVSPNMGYNSSPATAFLMTLFNVRLGAWLPNPGYSHSADRMLRAAPSSALRALLSELTGRANDTSRNIYLSDGGHFENLGIYEMVRRRCRYIIVSDAGDDAEVKFEDLGNAIRKVMADLDGASITFRELKVKSRKEQIDPPAFYALGEIDYGDGEIGRILYLKPSYFTTRMANSKSELAVDIRSYANLHDRFPHESTLDQWFSESQFESYRRLGEMLMSDIVKRNSYATLGIKGLFEDLA